MGNLRKPIVVGDDGQLEELQAGDYLNDDQDSFTGVADETITAKDTVYSTSTGKVKKASASASATADSTVGFALTSVTIGQSVECQTSGVLPMSALTAGAVYFLGEAAGTMTTTPPSGAGKVLKQLGIALTATELQIQQHQRIKRA